MSIVVAIVFSSMEFCEDVHIAFAFRTFGILSAVPIEVLCRFTAGKCLGLAVTDAGYWFCLSFAHGDFIFQGLYSILS